MSVRSSSVPVSKPGLAVGTLRRALLGAVLLFPLAGVIHAYTVTLDPDAPQTIYLQVGVGSFTADYCGGTTYPPTHSTPACGPQYGGGTPQKNTTVNTVSVTLTAAATGPLTDSAGDTIPFTQITTAAAANTATYSTLAAPALSNTSSSETITATNKVVMADAKWTFSYANAAAEPAGTYGGTTALNGVVTYTASMP